MKSFEEFKFAQAFRIPIEKSDNLRFLVGRPNSEHESRGQYYDGVDILDISKTGVGFSCAEKFQVGQRLSISLQYRRFHLDILARVVRATAHPTDPSLSQYGLEYDDFDEEEVHTFLENFASSFTLERMRTCLIKMALMDRYAVSAEGLDIVSLIITLFKDIIRLGDNENFISTVLQEALRNMQAQKAVLFLIDTKTNELVAQAAVGVDKTHLRFDYRVGVAGQIFTTGLPFNVDIKKDQGRFHEGQDIPELSLDKAQGNSFVIMGHPIYNRNDKIVGVIEVMERPGQSGPFTVEDEKTMKVLSMIFSSVYHNYNPLTQSSKVRNFGAYERTHALVGTSRYVADLRLSISKLKDLDLPLLLEGEVGVGKSLYAHILHQEGKRGPMPLIEIDCGEVKAEQLESMLFSAKDCAFLRAHKGSLIIHQVHLLDQRAQTELLKVMKERYLLAHKINVDVRVMATSTLSLEKASLQGKFLPELYQHLSSSLVKIPALRKHLEDLPELCEYFLKAECKKQGYLPKSFSAKALEQLARYRFNENIKELRSIVERSVRYFPKDHVIDDLGNSVLQVFHQNPDDFASVTHLLANHPHLKWEEMSFKDQVTLMEKDLLERHIHRFEGNKTRAAKALGITREGIRKILIKAERLLATPEATVLEFAEKKKETPNTEDTSSKKGVPPLKDAA